MESPVIDFYKHRLAKLDIHGLYDEAASLYARSRTLLAEVESFRDEFIRRREAVSDKRTLEDGNVSGFGLQNQKAEVGFGSEVES